MQSVLPCKSKMGRIPKAYGVLPIFNSALPEFPNVACNRNIRLVTVLKVRNFTMNKEIDISNIILTTERLTLRPWKKSDLNDL